MDSASSDSLRLPARSTAQLGSAPGTAGGEFSDTVEWQLSADGQRFVVVETLEPEEAEAPSIRVVQNWYEGFHDHEQG